MDANEYSQIVEGCRRRDKAAQRALYEASVGMAMGVCMRFASCRDEAQDMLHDGYVRVYEQIGSLRKPESLMSWIYTVMVNTCSMICRRATFERVSEDMEPMAGTIDYDLYSQMDVVSAMQQLNARMRAVVNLHDVEGYTHEEIAHQLGMKAGAVRVTLMRAHRKMRECLEQEPKEKQ